MLEFLRRSRENVDTDYVKERLKFALAVGISVAATVIIGSLVLYFLRTVPKIDEITLLGSETVRMAVPEVIMDADRTPRLTGRTFTEDVPVVHAGSTLTVRPIYTLPKDCLAHGARYFEERDLKSRTGWSNIVLTDAAGPNNRNDDKIITYPHLDQGLMYYGQGLTSQGCGWLSGIIDADTAFSQLYPVLIAAPAPIPSEPQAPAPSEPMPLPPPPLQLAH